MEIGRDEGKRDRHGCASRRHSVHCFAYASADPRWHRLSLPVGEVPLMTNYGYLLVMKQVMIADLKAKLSEYLRYVRQGHTVTVLDRHTPVAQIVPITTRATLRVREPRRVYEKLGDIPLPPPVGLDVDVLEVLAEERQSHR